MSDAEIIAGKDQTLIDEDRAARAEALDVSYSFLVQAPAGSGKTELLIQRYLALLAGVTHPERVLAMTFTRKAAAEMRERVIHALRAARNGSAVTALHEKITRQLARAVLKQDEKQQWQLIEQPSRLQVTTIDAFCARLLRQTPLVSRWGAMPTVEEFVQPRYEAAVREALHEADAEAQLSWQCVLGVLGNNADRLLRTMTNLLGKRDQWQSLLRSDAPQEWRRMLEAVLKEEITQELTQVRAVLTKTLPLSALASLMRYAAAHLDANDSEKALAQSLEACVTQQELPPAESGALQDWRYLADWLLTQSENWRKKVTKAQGFPPKGSGAGAVERESQKKAMEALLAALGDSSAVVLSRVRVLPPFAYREDEWRFIDALLYLLPRLLAHFQVMCTRDGVIDFAGIQLAALEALGEEEEPSDVLLALDMRIDHLLIDEFQDTSQTQMSLLRKLTAGWQPGDRRTLFAVGDPMQSIYRFRQAEVGLFLEAQQRQQINEVPVKLLTLTRNFRSQARLVEWANDIFPEVFTRDPDPLRGAVAFKPSAPVRETGTSVVTICVLSDTVEEGACVAQQVATALAQGARDVAILVRARTHLQEILPALRAQGIIFTAVRLDRLKDRQGILDLLMLTHTLIQPDDELAWLSVVRAPWCGLSLADLTTLLRARESHDGEMADASPRLRDWMAVLLDAPERIAGLSEDGRARLAHVMQCWHAAQTAIHDRLAQRVYRCWLALRGPSCVSNKADRLAIASFLECLDTFEAAGDIFDWPMLVRRIDEAFLPEDVVDAEESIARVKVMTLHQAKGLQFDTVIMPGLGRRTQKQEKPLLRWRQRPRGLLLATVQPRSTIERKVGGDADLDGYLSFLEEEEARHELARLLYVGVTRAEQRLVLTAVASVKETSEKETKKKAGEEAYGEVVTNDCAVRRWNAPYSGSAMALWWDVLQAKDAILPPTSEHHAETETPMSTMDEHGLSLWRLPTACFQEVAALVSTERPRSHAAALCFDEANISARHVGTVVHQWLSCAGIPNGHDVRDWTSAFCEAQRWTIAYALAELGTPVAQVEQSVSKVIAALTALREDPFAQWLLDSTHEAARNEWALSAQGEAHDDSVHLRLDRTFIYEGTRYIIDYKTAEAPSGDIDVWLDAEVKRYRPQLQHYAELMQWLESRPLKLLLYYPLLQRWREIALVQ